MVYNLRTMRHERDEWKEGLGTGFIMGTSLAGMIFLGVGLASGKFDSHPPVIDCGSGRQGSIDLMLPKNGDYSMSAVDGNKDISFINNPDGSLTIQFDKADTVIHLPKETVTVKQIDLQPGEEVSFEDSAAQIKIVENPVGNGSDNIQISGTCNASK